jgi:hypothetical protein
MATWRWRLWLVACVWLAVAVVAGAEPRRAAAGSGRATVREYKKVFRTYPFSDPNPIPVVGRIYPYFRFEGYTDVPVDKAWTVVELENDYLLVTILPEIGGKIWSAVEKSTGRSFIYDNHVVKFRDIAMRGPWTSGGIESNYGIIGHTPNCATPVDYATATGPDGATVVIGVLDLLTRTPWRLEDFVAAASLEQQGRPAEARALLDRLSASGGTKPGLGRLLAAVASRATGRQAEGEGMLSEWAGQQLDPRVADWGRRLYAGERPTWPAGAPGTVESRVLVEWTAR